MRIFLLLLICVTISAQAQCIRTAPFEDANYEVDGTVTIEYTLSGSKLLKIESDFLTMDGPDLHVYLSNISTIDTSEGSPEGAIDLGILSSVSGASQYTIPESIEINEYAYIIIHCQNFNQPWGNATLGATQGEDCSSLSIDETFLETIKFYPNPAKNKISFNLITEENIQVTIYSYSGIKILQKKVNSLNNEIDINTISSGVYLIELVSESKRSIRKLIVN